MAEPKPLSVDDTMAVGATIRADAVPGSLAAAESIAPRSLPVLELDLAEDGGSGDFEVRALLGEGGMGRVVLARQHSLGRDVAIKTGKPGADRSVLDAIVAEGSVTGRLEHPAIVPVHALGHDRAGRPALVMKRIEGVGWDRLLAEPRHEGWEGWESDERDRLPAHLAILGAISNALHFAHSRGVVHRDVKPENVLIGRFGDVYLADWGVAGHAGAGDARICGTPGYMAPEMVTRGRIDARTDVYLLGATLHFILTGRMRHDAATPSQAIRAAQISAPHEYGPPLPRELGELANAACSPDPARRPPSAQAFRDRINAYLRHKDAAALAAEAIDRKTKLEALLASDAPGEDERREIDRLIAEVRFGLEQALARWSDNRELAAELERLEGLLEARRARTAALEAESRDRDPRTGARGRAIALSLLAAAVVAMGLVPIVFPRPITMFDLVGYPVVMVVLVLVGAYLFRRSLGSNRFNRQIYLSFLLTLAVWLLARLIGTISAVPAHEQFARDSLLMGGMALLIGVAYIRWAAALGAVMLSAGFVIAWVPDRAYPIFAGAGALSIALGALFSWTTRGSAARQS